MAGWRASTPLPDDVAVQLDLYLPYCLSHPRGLAVAHIGQSLDGRIATENGDSRWIIGEADLLHCHRMRALADAVLVGARTVRADDPQLTVRRCAGDNPYRVVIDPELSLTGRHGIFRDRAAPTLVVATREEHGDRQGETHGCEILGVPRVGSTLDVRRSRTALGDRGLSVVFVEGGGITISHFLEAGCLNRLQITVAPIIIGSGRPVSHFPATVRSTADCGRGSAVSTLAVTRCSIVISMSEALSFGSPRRAGAESELNRYDPWLLTAKVRFLPCPI
jgi:diaminohydroxyphosphoribosylaminopyrimidine deaminase / 5-amino-6-(5-phosphoribosylamino)uracil reductase